MSRRERTRIGKCMNFDNISQFYFLRIFKPPHDKDTNRKLMENNILYDVSFLYVPSGWGNWSTFTTQVSHGHFVVIFARSQLLPCCTFVGAVGIHVAPVRGGNPRITGGVHSPSFFRFRRVTQVKCCLEALTLLCKNPGPDISYLASLSFTHHGAITSVQTSR